MAPTLSNYVPPGASPDFQTPSHSSSRSPVTKRIDYCPLPSTGEAIGHERNHHQEAIYRRAFSVVSSRPFTDVVAALDAAIGHPDMKSFSAQIAAAETYSERRRIVQNAVSASDLMEFIRFDLGEVVRKENRRGQSPDHETNGRAYP
jgi:hypothetical protein